MSNFIPFVIIMLLAVSSGTACGQKQAQTDSLLKELPGRKDDTNKVKLLNALSASYSSIEPGKGIQYGQQGLDLATRLHWNEGIAEANVSLAANYKAKPDNEKELACLLMALNHYEAAGDSNGTVTAMGMIGNNYRRANNYTSALDFYLKGLKLAEKQGLKHKTADYADVVCNIYCVQSEYSKALEYGFQELKLTEELGDKKGYERAESSIGRIYIGRGDRANATAYLSKALQLAEEIKETADIAHISINLGNVLLEKQDYPEAMKYYQRSLQVSEEIGDTKIMGTAICCIGAVYERQQNYLMAADNFQRALEIFEANGDKYQIGASLVDIGSSFLGMAYYPRIAARNTAELHAGAYRPALPGGKPLPPIPRGKAALIAGAINHLQRALVVLKDIKELDFMKNCYQVLSEAYQMKGDYKTAMEYADSSRAIKDSLYSQENTRKIVQQELKYTYERREDSIKLKNAETEHASVLKLQRQRNYTAIGIAGMIILLVFSFFIVWNYRIQKQLNDTISKLVGEQEETIRQRTLQLLESNRRLTNANQKLLQLIQYNAHNLREPLTRVMGAMIMQEYMTSEEFYKDIWPQMHRAVTDLDNSIKNVISLADETVELYS